jgi:hypothetical protein
VCTGTDSAYVNDSAMERWILDCLLQACPVGPILLISDVWGAHSSPATLALCAQHNIHSNTIPADCTGLVQVLDTHVNRVFRANYEQAISRDVAITLDRDGNTDCTYQERSLRKLQQVHKRNNNFVPTVLT